MQKVSGYRFQASGFAALVLVLACACFGCAGEQGQARAFTARVAYRVQANLNGGDKNLGDILNAPASAFLRG